MPLWQLHIGSRRRDARHGRCVAAHVSRRVARARRIGDGLLHGEHLFEPEADSRVDNRFVVPGYLLLALYSGALLLWALATWPDASVRFAMPLAPALVIGFADRLRCAEVPLLARHRSPGADRRRPCDRTRSPWNRAFVRAAAHRRKLSDARDGLRARAQARGNVARDHVDSRIRAAGDARDSRHPRAGVPAAHAHAARSSSPSPASSSSAGCFLPKRGTPSSRTTAASSRPGDKKSRRELHAVGLRFTRRFNRATLDSLLLRCSNMSLNQ